MKTLNDYATDFANNISFEGQNLREESKTALKQVILQAFFAGASSACWIFNEHIAETSEFSVGMLKALRK